MKQTQDPRDETAATGKFFRSVRRNEDVPTSTTVIEAIAAVSDGDATDLPPLYDSIDPNALNALFDSEKAHSEQPLSVSFAYLGYKVCVCGSRTDRYSIRDRRHWPLKSTLGLLLPLI